MAMSVDVIVIIIIVGILGAIAFKTVIKKKAKAKAAKIISKVYAVWAEMGPYKNGEASRIGMQYAYKAVNSPDLDKDNEALVLNKHAAAYDSDPEQWENLRQDVLSYPKMLGFEDHLTMAKGMAAVNVLNEGMFKDAGFQVGFERNANGNTVITSKGLKGEEINDELKHTGNAITYAIKNDIGNKLFSDSSIEAETLVDALKIIYKNINDREIKSVQELGEFYLFMFDFSKANPDSSICKSFVELNTLWLDSKATPDKSGNPQKSGS